MAKIPLSKKLSFTFVSNIKDPLATKANPYPKLVDSFLLSETYSTPQTLALCKKAKQNNCLLISDNGNFSRMKIIADAWLDEGAIILTTAQADILRLGRIRKTTLEQRKKLINKIISLVKIEQSKIDLNTVLKRQAMCQPHYMIGMEDLTIPVLHLCNMLHSIFKPKAIDLKEFQQQTWQLYQWQQKQDHTASNKNNTAKFLVYHAYDYESAHQLAVMHKKHRPDAIAISFGGALASRNFISSIEIQRNKYAFTEKLPAAYLLSIALLAGASSSHKKLPIHILGVGTPILIILMSLLLQKSKSVSIDSTATFKDADDGNIYGSRYAYLKMDMFKVAAYALVDNEPYFNTSPWFKWFDKKHPSDWQGLREKLKITEYENISELAKKLKAHPKLIERYIPFFTPMRSGQDSLIKNVRIARTACNYWVLNKICKKIRLRSNSVRLKHWVKNEVDRYIKVADPKWATTVQQCYEIITKLK